MSLFFRILFIINFSLFFAYEANSKPINSENKKSVRKKRQADLEVEWYEPIIKKVDKKKQTRRVLISGRTQPGSKISISKQRIMLYSEQQKKVQFIKTERTLLKDQKSIARLNGYFEIELDLPLRIAWIPVLVAPPKKNKMYAKTYHLNLSVKGGKTILQVKDIKITRKIVKKPPPRYGVWFGLGTNILLYEQNSDQTGKAKYTTIEGPALYGEIYQRFSARWQASFSAKSSPGTASSSEKIVIPNGHYEWLIFSLEGLYFPKTWKSKYKLFGKSLKSRWGIRFGLQHHIVPFISRTGTSAEEAEILTNYMTMATGGMELNIKRRLWTFQTFLRYQYPMAEGDVFSLTPQFAFDGSLGMIRKLRRSKWSLGGFWYGQWHKYNFTHFDRFSKKDADGTQSLFFSNIEFRIRYQF